MHLDLLQLGVLLHYKKSRAQLRMVMLSQQRILFKSKLPISLIRSRNHNRIMSEFMACLLDLRLLHARTRISSNNPNISNKRDRSGQVTLHNRRSVPRSSSQEYLQVHRIPFLESLRLRLESWDSTFIISHNINHLNRRRKLLTSQIPFLSHHPRSPWIFHLSYHLFRQI
jgi:hypothetical protein